ncbi:MAG: hypothetical protein M3P29_03195 [Acidobacteriota bacterium]|nr:hypothetical protein [Acidobacteriota bacterium]
MNKFEVEGLANEESVAALVLSADPTQMVRALEAAPEASSAIRSFCPRF